MKIFCFDIDGTICNNTYGKYHLAKPYLDRIQKINDLFNQGNEIVFCTARGMGSSNGDQIEANKKYYEYTYKQLISWGCKFHKLYLGKPKSDLYIDDKAIIDNDFFRNL